MKLLCWGMFGLVVLSGCTASAKFPHGPRTVSTTPSVDPEQDSGPAVPPDLSGVTEPIPADEPKSKYGNPSSYTVLGQTYQVLPSAEDFKQRGIASWYGNKFHGKRTSSGEPYDMYKMTAAHKTLPIPVHVRVTNLDNGKSIIVRVNDRGPFVKDRIIDLSYAAAHKIGMANIGTARVEIETLTGSNIASSNVSTSGTSATSHRPTVGSAGADIYYVQIASFSREQGAQDVARQLTPLVGHPVVVQKGNADGNAVYRVRVGPLSKREYAETVQTYLSDKGYRGTTIVTP